MSDRSPFQRGLIRESTLFGILFLVGICLIPPAVYLIGTMVFGEYSEGGFSAFARRLMSDLVNGSRPLWFLVLAPYLVIQSLRIAVWGVRRGPAATAGR